jgi:hypothetical protein
MDLREHQAIRGQLTIVLRDEHGSELERRTVHNLITKVGRKLLADLLMGKLNATPNRWTVAVGTGTADPTVEDTQLQAQVDSADDSLPKVEIVTVGAVPTIRITVTATLPAPTSSSPQALTEAGILVQMNTNPPTATLFNHVTFAQINRSGNMVMTLMWQITL